MQWSLLIQTCAWIWKKDIWSKRIFWQNAMLCLWYHWIPRQNKTVDLGSKWILSFNLATACIEHDPMINNENGPLIQTDLGSDRIRLIHASFIAANWEVLTISLKMGSENTYLYNCESKIPVEPGAKRCLRSRIRRIRPPMLKSQWVHRQILKLDLWSKCIRDPDPRDQIPGSVFRIRAHVWLLFYL